MCVVHDAIAYAPYARCLIRQSDVLMSKINFGLQENSYKY
jgi:hypothetical protein